MSGYKPTFIGGYEAGLIQQRENFLLSNDGFPQLINAYIWRERIKRKQGVVTLGRLRRIFDDYQTALSAGPPWNFNLFTTINKTGTIIGGTPTNPIQLTTGAAHGMFTGQFVTLSGITWNTFLNGGWQITVTGANTFTIDVNGLTYGAFGGGGNWETGNTGTITDEPNKTIECGSVQFDFSPTGLSTNLTGYNSTGTENQQTRFTTAAPHGLVIGNEIKITGVKVIPKTGPNKINGGPYIITVQNSPTTFRIELNSSKFGRYSSGGVVTRISSTKIVDDGNGNLLLGAANVGSINYITGDVTITGQVAGQIVLASFNYFPGLPVMGILDQETVFVNSEDTIFFDTKYAYQWNNGFEEFLPGTTWTGTDFQFFWGTNYWVDDANNKIFWETTFNSDPIRYTNGNEGTNWVNFSPILNAAGDQLNTCRAMLPFRGRMVVFNTIENNVAYPNRIRWAQIGNPFTVSSYIVTVDPLPAGQQPNAWRDDIRGKGGFLDIPTNEDIITVGFVRDNLVVYCERSTWQLRYTGRSIAPFQIEKVNTELGVESTFSGIQFDTSIVGIGDKGIVECDSYKSQRIDVKIPDLVQSQITNLQNGTERVYGVRDFEKRLAYWIYPNVTADLTDSAFRGPYPNRRLCYNYENDSWSIFTDSLTALGSFQNVNSPIWLDYPDTTWALANFPWQVLQSEFPIITGGNQQGYIVYLNQQVGDDKTLFITNIQGHETTLEPTEVTSPNHNLEDGYIIKIINIGGTSTNFTGLNDQIFSVVVTGLNTFLLYVYNSANDDFSTPRLDANANTYLGCGEIEVRDKFSIVSKRFNYNDQGRQYQLGYIDLLVETTQEGAFTMNIYNDYNSYVPNNASNRAPLNVTEDDFFNSVIETKPLPDTIDGGEKQWRRVFCPTNSNFITIEYTLSNSQMIGVEQESDVVIDAQTIWARIGGRLGLTS